MNRLVRAAGRWLSVLRSTPTWRAAVARVLERYTQAALARQYFEVYCKMLSAG